MNRREELTNICCAILLGILVLSQNAAADAFNKKTIVTFSGPVEIPGKVLPAGTYVFKLLDTLADRNVVQIFNKDENKVYATILAVPDYRLTPTGETVIMFEERAKNAPPAIRAWFYPGDSYGQQFVYPKPRAVQLAKESNQNVISMPANMEANINKEAKTKEAVGVKEMENAPLMGQQPSGGEVEIDVIIKP